MNIDYLQLHKPLIKISFSSTLNEIIEKLFDKGFKCTLTYDNKPIVHGKSWINSKERVVLHMYFHQLENKLESIMMHSVPLSKDDSIKESFERKERWLNEFYGNPIEKVFNSQYGVYDTKRNGDYFEINHFVKDRYGDEEGIYFKMEVKAQSIT